MWSETPQGGMRVWREVSTAHTLKYSDSHCQNTNCRHRAHTLTAGSLKHCWKITDQCKINTLLILLCARIPVFGHCRMHCLHGSMRRQQICTVYKEREALEQKQFCAPWILLDWDLWIFTSSNRGTLNVLLRRYVSDVRIFHWFKWLNILIGRLEYFINIWR